MSGCSLPPHLPWHPLVIITKVVVEVGSVEGEEAQGISLESHQTDPTEPDLPKGPRRNKHPQVSQPAKARGPLAAAVVVAVAG